MTRPSGTNDDTVWSNAGTNTDPGLTKINNGWIFQEKPPFDYFNWWQNKVDRWIAYLDGLGNINQVADLAGLKAIDTTGLSNTGNTFAIVNKYGLYQLLNDASAVENQEFTIIPTTGTAGDYWQLLIPHADAIFAYVEPDISDLQENKLDISDFNEFRSAIEIPPIIDNTITTTTVNFPGYATVIDDNFDVTRLGEYILTISYSFNRSVSNNDFMSRLLFDGVALGKSTEDTPPDDDKLIHREQVNESTLVDGGGELSATGSSQIFSHVQEFKVDITTIGTKNVQFLISGESGGNTSSVWDIVIELRRAD